MGSGVYTVPFTGVIYMFFIINYGNISNFKNIFENN